jgi:hypothetical protein
MDDGNVKKIIKKLLKKKNKVKGPSPSSLPGLPAGWSLLPLSPKRTGCRYTGYRPRTRAIGPILEYFYFYFLLLLFLIKNKI